MPGISRLWTDQTIVQSVPTMSVLILLEFEYRVAPQKTSVNS